MRAVCLEGLHAVGSVCGQGSGMLQESYRDVAVQRGEEVGVQHLNALCYSVPNSLHEQRRTQNTGVPPSM